MRKKSSPKRDKVEEVSTVFDGVDFLDFIIWMIALGSGLGDNPKTLGASRPKGLRKDPKKYAAYMETVRAKQLRASRATMKEQLTIREIASGDELFKECCYVVGAEPSRRQYSKWMRGRGMSRTMLRGALDSRVGGATLALTRAENDLVQAVKQFESFSVRTIVQLAESGSKIFTTEEIGEIVAFMESDDAATTARLAFMTTMYEKIMPQLEHNKEMASSGARSAETALQDTRTYRMRLLPCAR